MISQEGAPVTSGVGWGGGTNLLFKKKFPENWMEMKKIELGGGGGASRILLCRSTTD